MKNPTRCEMTLPVLPFGVKQRAAGSGVVFSGAGQNQWSLQLSRPAPMPASRGLTITVAPIVAGTVFDALDYLTSYPWGCTEQTMSSFLPDVIVAQARRQAASQVAHRSQDAERHGERRAWSGSTSFQHDDGGWGWWPDDPSRVFMTAYVVSGLGQAKDAGYTIDDDRLNKARNWLLSTLAAHPDMIPDLRAYVVYALATTGGAPKDALDKAWESRDKLSDEGLALAGLALDAAGDAARTRPRELLEKKAKATDVDAHWEGNYDGLLEYWDDTSPETTAFALKLLVRQDRIERPAAQGRALAGRASRRRLLVLDQADRDGDPGPHRLPGAERRAGQQLRRRSAGERRKRGQAPLRSRRRASPLPWQIKVPAAQAGSGGQVTIRKSGNGITYWSAESTWYSADRKSLPAGQARAQHHARLLRAPEAAGQAHRSHHLRPGSAQGPGARRRHRGRAAGAERHQTGSICWPKIRFRRARSSCRTPALYTLNNKPDWWADWFTRKEFHDDRAAFFNTDFSGAARVRLPAQGGQPRQVPISPAQAGPMYQSNVETTTDPATLEVQP